MNETAPTVFVVDDDEAVRKAVQWLAEGAGLGAKTFPSAAEFLKQYDPAAPGCLVLDIRMPGMSGLELQDKLAEMNFAIPVIIVTGHADVPTAVHAMRHGAIDVVQKPIKGPVLLERIRQAIDRDAKSRVAAQEVGEISGRLASLTPRERDVMDLIMGGRLNKQIATQLNLSIRTVEKHRAQIMAKMHANTVADLVLMTIKGSAKVG